MFLYMMNANENEFRAICQSGVAICLKTVWEKEIEIGATRKSQILESEPKKNPENVPSKDIYSHYYY